MDRKDSDKEALLFSNSKEDPRIGSEDNILRSRDSHTSTQSDNILSSKMHTSKSSIKVEESPAKEPSRNINNTREVSNDIHMETPPHKQKRRSKREGS